MRGLGLNFILFFTFFIRNLLRELRLKVDSVLHVLIIRKVVRGYGLKGCFVLHVFYKKLREGVQTNSLFCSARFYKKHSESARAKSLYSST